MRRFYTFAGSIGILLFLGAILITYFHFCNSVPPNVNFQGKINGANLVGTSQRINLKQLKTLSQNHIEWTSLVPYAFSRNNVPGVHYNKERQWWGEKVIGIYETAILSLDANLKIMIKPHIWVIGEGWPGDFDLDSEEKWLDWGKNYHNYIMAFADLADSVSAEIFCIGTEYRVAVIKRPEFWKRIISIFYFPI